MKQFLYFLTVPGNEPFLKEELNFKYPKQFSFSFSRPGICTFRNNGPHLSLNSIKELDVIYAKGQGETLGIMTAENLSKTIKDYTSNLNQSFYITQVIPESHTYHPYLINEINEPSTWQQASYFIIIVQMGNNQFIVGVQLKDQFNSPPGRIFGNLENSDSPSRAYFKIKETFELLGKKESHPLQCIEFGCAPGGSSKYLLDKGHQVIGVDPAKMDLNILKHPNFNFINKPMQEIKRELLPSEIDCLISDVNLNPKVVLRYLTKIFETHAPQEAYITIKTPTPTMLHEAKIWTQSFKSLGYQNVQYLQLSAHRKECLAMAF